MIHDLLAGLGWSAFQMSQLSLDELELTPARIAEVHRSRALGLTADGTLDLSPPGDMPMADLAVGDWVLARDGRILRRLDRRASLERRAAGTGVARQAIAANVDTVLIVTSCNAEFSERRTERYLAVAEESGAEAVLVLTKPDLAPDPEAFLSRARQVARHRAVVALDARDPASPALLAEWCRPGRTVALLGSSGVGKTTLTNSLTGAGDLTAPIREDDGKGRHTTTWRALRPLVGGGWIIDTPGMRALRLTDVAEGLDATFDEVSELARRCRFRDCTHVAEPGCAVRQAIDDGTIDPDRLHRWQKLKREDRVNSELLHEKHARFRQFGKVTRRAMRDKRRMQGFDGED